MPVPAVELPTTLAMVCCILIVGSESVPYCVRTNTTRAANCVSANWSLTPRMASASSPSSPNSASVEITLELRNTGSSNGNVSSSALSHGPMRPMVLRSAAMTGRGSSSNRLIAIPNTGSAIGCNSLYLAARCLSPRDRTNVVFAAQVYLDLQSWCGQQQIVLHFVLDSDHQVLRLTCRGIWIHSKEPEFTHPQTVSVLQHFGLHDL